MRNLSDQWDALATWFALTNHQTYASTQLYIITRVITFWGHVQVVICKYQRQRHSHAFLQAAAKLPVIGETPKCKETQDKQAVLSRKKHTQYCCGACAFRFPGRLSLDMRQDCRRTYRGWELTHQKVARRERWAASVLLDFPEDTKSQRELGVCCAH